MIRACLVLALAASVSACRPAPDRPAGSIAETTFAASLEIDLERMTQSASGLYFRDLVEGTGPAAEAGQLVSVRYVGSFPDGNGFDRNMGSAPPFQFRLGRGEVIPGWDEGLVGMRVGGRRQLVLPGHLGYGANGNGPIPPDAILVFLVELVAVE